MKKLAFFLALFVGLNAGGIARKPEDEDNQAVIVRDTPRRSTAAFISMIANTLRACYYGVTKDGFIQELRLDLIQKMKKKQSVEWLNENCSIEIDGKRKVIWIQMSYHFENDSENVQYQLYVKNKIN